MDNSPLDTNNTRFVRKKNLQGMLEQVTQEMYKRNFELAETNKTLSLLRQIDELALESHDELEVFSTRICEIVAAKGEYALTALLGRPVNDKRYLELFGVSNQVGFTEKQSRAVEKIKVAADSDWLKADEHIMFVDMTAVTADKLRSELFLSDDEISSVQTVLSGQTLVLIKLIARDQLVGLMIINVRQPLSDIQQASNKLFERLSDAVGLALDNKILLEENARIVKQLKNSNEKLKALDETKDEFISMASHQLRTPLTSVKGYLSMVLEGDAGDVGPMQRKLLDQAFVSSQRMVYLIADLLNVSRLRTGKFVLEPVESNLADVVEGEIGQLKETAAGRGLELTYDKPENFPSLFLDETKIRQVIMNFTDNAIYYTPQGGHINVKLEDKGESIEFTVTDDGMGVPKAQQPHMFTKFYRADNARKARPDGTGLGLFMAKKVIVTQGGNIIFSSQEGKGSTFGFALPKAKLQSPTVSAKES